MSSFPKSFGVLLYPEFELLDVAGPLEALACLSRHEGYEDISLSIISETKNPVATGPEKSFMGSIKWVPTHSLQDAPHLDVLIIPGGVGSMDLEAKTISPKVDPYVDFIRKAYNGQDGHQKLHSIISVCNGVMLLAKAGILDGRKATGNKDFWEIVTSAGKKTHWIAKARWQQSGNIWTTSGVSAGADGTLAWIESLAGKEIVDRLARNMEWIRAESVDNDPFAAIEGAEDVLPKE